MATQTAVEDRTTDPVREGYPDHRRMVRFDWSKTPLHWVPGDPFSTHMINVLHLLLPAGERWFIGVIREAAPYISDPEVAEAIKPFVQ
jgi:predicted metal-dependent hydrolase